MYFFSLVAAFLLLRHLRKWVVDTPVAEKWNSFLHIATWVTLGILVLLPTTLSDEIADLVAGLYLTGIIGKVYFDPDLMVKRPLLQAFYPFVLVVLISSSVQLIAPEFYKEWDGSFDMALLAAFVYIFAAWAVYNKNQTELEKERQKRITEEKEKNLISIKKSELEILVASRTAELTIQKKELQQMVNELKATQAQLIQQEKLASLGELTAGIAHEIQNPLNFVNNFSEVSAELLDELEEELEKGDKEEAMAIAMNLKENLQKINHHGKRADSIVKGMLLHSRVNNGQKEPTDLNALADEYMRLSYHGLRAKDKTFNSELITEFDPEVGKVEVVPQDLGRVLLNLFNNAFYSVLQKQKSLGADAGYKPKVAISSKRIDAEIEIRIKDNGLGIPEHIKPKILQPFFTTKPTGQGTGLGLSLSYDIIAKGHGGTLAIETQEGMFAEFIIRIPSKKEKLILI